MSEKKTNKPPCSCEEGTPHPVVKCKKCDVPMLTRFAVMEGRKIESPSVEDIGFGTS